MTSIDRILYIDCVDWERPCQYFSCDMTAVDSVNGGCWPCGSWWYAFWRGCSPEWGRGFCSLLVMCLREDSRVSVREDWAVSGGVWRGPLAERERPSDSEEEAACALLSPLGNGDLMRGCQKGKVYSRRACLYEACWNSLLFLSNERNILSVNTILAATATALPRTTCNYYRTARPRLCSSACVARKKRDPRRGRELTAGLAYRTAAVHYRGVPRLTTSTWLLADDYWRLAEGPAWLVDADTTTCIGRNCIRGKSGGGYTEAFYHYGEVFCDTDVYDGNLFWCCSLLPLLPIEGHWWRL